MHALIWRQNWKNQLKSIEVVKCRRCKRYGFHPWVWKIPWSKTWQHTPVFLPEKLQRQRRLVDYSPRGCKGSDTTEWLLRAASVAGRFRAAQGVRVIYFVVDSLNYVEACIIYFNWILFLTDNLFFSCSGVSDSLWPRGLQHARLPCPSPSPRPCLNSCPWSRWCQPAISSSVVPFSSCLQFFPASGSFLLSQVFTSGGQSIGASASASVLPVNIQSWFPLGFTGLIFLHSQESSPDNMGSQKMFKPFSKNKKKWRQKIWA